MTQREGIIAINMTGGCVCMSRSVFLFITDVVLYVFTQLVLFTLPDVSQNVRLNAVRIITAHYYKLHIIIITVSDNYCCLTIFRSGLKAVCAKLFHITFSLILPYSAIFLINKIKLLLNGC